VSINEKGSDSPFQRVDPGVFALREWDVSDYLSESEGIATGEDRRVRVPLFPTYATARHFLRIVDGVSAATYREMEATIREQTGTPQNPVNWSDPDTWIDERLSGDNAALARRIWKESDHELNPRYTRGSHHFLKAYDFIRTTGHGTLRATEAGERFLDGDPDVIRAIDEVEGIGKLLNILATKGRAKRADLLPEWQDYLDDVSTYGSQSTYKDTLRRRIDNVIERGLVERDGHTNVITQSGLDYAATFARHEGGSPKQELQQALKEHNDAQRAALRERLATMDPYLFEQLARDLLEAMGYEDVEVTKQSGDKGIDVVATVQFGITEVQEVVQVKRTKSAVGRPILDQLRGALPYHDAIRGTIIALGGFTKGCKDGALFTGAAPITLIDGERLLDLLIEHEIGLQKKPAVLYEVDERYFEEREQS
jgi:restriction system protein